MRKRQVVTRPCARHEVSIHQLPINETSCSQEALPPWVTRRRFAPLRPSAAFTLIPLIAICLTLAGCGINTIPTYEQNAKAAWTEVLNQYKRRADLIPNLVETVKGFADQESTVLTDVVEARAKATQVQANCRPTS